MKLLILNASPRRNGLIASMLEAMKEEADQQGIETVNITVDDLKIHPCTGCMKCRKNGRCALPSDDGQRMARLLTDADALLIGSPCYWSNMPGTLKLMFDRLVYVLMKEGKYGLPQPLHKGKQAVIVTTCTTPWPFNLWLNQSSGTIKAIRRILKCSGFRLIGTLERGGTKNNPLLNDQDLKQCRKIIRKLSQVGH